MPVKSHRQRAVTGKRRHRHLINRHLPRARPRKSCNRTQQRRLAHPVRPGEDGERPGIEFGREPGHEFAGPARDADIGQSQRGGPRIGWKGENHAGPGSELRFGRPRYAPKEYCTHEITESSAATKSNPSPTRIAVAPSAASCAI